MKKRDEATCNIPGAYLQANLSSRNDGNKTLLKLKGYSADFICDVSSKHKKNVVYEKGTKIIVHENTEKYIWLHLICLKMV